MKAEPVGGGVSEVLKDELFHDEGAGCSFIPGTSTPYEQQEASDELSSLDLS